MIEKLGLFALFIGCLLSATIIPFSSEAILTSAILLKYNKLACVIVATLGNTCGGMISYLLGYWFKWQWLEKYFHVKKEKIEYIHEKIAPYGIYAGFFTWLPFIGDIIAIAMGFIRVNPYLSCLFMLIGKLLRYIVLIYIINIFL